MLWMPYSPDVLHSRWSSFPLPNVPPPTNAWVGVRRGRARHVERQRKRKDQLPGITVSRLYVEAIRRTRTWATAMVTALCVSRVVLTETLGTFIESSSHCSL